MGDTGVSAYSEAHRLLPVDVSDIRGLVVHACLLSSLAFSLVHACFCYRVCLGCGKEVCLPVQNIVVFEWLFAMYVCCLQ